MTIWNLPRIDVLPVSEIGEQRDVALVYSQAALEAVGHRLDLPVASRGEATQATEASFRAIAEGVFGDVVYAVGGGVAVDAAKFVGKLKDLPVVSIPTALTVDAFFTWASGVRAAGCVKYIETGPPDRVIIDFEILGAAPEPLRAAGVCDLLSIATGSWDWRFANEKGKLDRDTAYIEWADRTAGSILEAAIDCAEAAGRGDREGLKQLVDCLALEVQLCNQIGHSRPEEGSEHYFAYLAEQIASRPHPHGDLVGPGILVAAFLQGQAIEPLKRALLAARVPLTHLTDTEIRDTLKALPDYVVRHDLAFGIAHTIASVPRDIHSVLR